MNPQQLRDLTIKYLAVRKEILEYLIPHGEVVTPAESAALAYNEGFYTGIKYMEEKAKLKAKSEEGI